MAKLYELAAEIEAVLAAADPDTGELPADLAERLDALGLSLETKADQCCRLVRQEQADATAYEQESRRLGDLAKAAWNRADRVKAYVRDCLQRAGLKKMQTELFQLTVCANGQPSVTLEDGAEIPRNYCRWTESLDKGAVIDAWKAGKPLPAGVSVATGSHLRLR
jgi:hypothetical protein